MPGDGNNARDVFVRDLVDGTTERVSVASDGGDADNDSGFFDTPSISADGRFVAFDSFASNLVDGDASGGVFVRDRQEGTTQLVSVATDGTPSFGDDPSISADGRFVAFSSFSSDLVPEDTNDESDVFVRDLQEQATQLVSVATGGDQANSSNFDPSISADGTSVAFSSDASNLVPGDGNDASDVFVRDLTDGTTERVSVDAAGDDPNGSSFAPSVSADGRFVAFESFASDLIAGDDGFDGVFVRDLLENTTVRASVSDDGESRSGSEPSIGADGDVVAFSSFDSDLVAGDDNGQVDVFVRDLGAGTTDRVSVAPDGTDADAFSEDPSISGDGRVVAFSSRATNLAGGALGGVSNVFARNVEDEATQRVSVPRDGEAGALLRAAFSSEAAVSGDGRFVAFSSDALDLVPGDDNGFEDVFVRDAVDGSVERVSVATDGGDADSPSSAPSISADGRYVAFVSFAFNLVDDGTIGGGIFVRDLQEGTTQRVSVATDGSGRFGSAPSISADGRFVAFESFESDLVAGDTNDETDVFVRDLQELTTERVSVASDGAEADDFSFGTSISADGNSVIFTSFATTLMPGDSGDSADVYLHDRAQQTTELVSLGDDGSRVDSLAFAPAGVSADGRFVAFTSFSSDVVDDGGFGGLFVRDRQEGSNRRVDVASDGDPSFGLGFEPSISADGRFVAFESFAFDLVPDDNNDHNDVFVRDLVADTTERVSVASDGSEGNDDSFAPSISADGRSVAFASEASNLAADDQQGTVDVFVRGRGTPS